MGKRHTHTCVHVCACMYARASAGQAPLACRMPVFVLRLPCAFQGMCGIWQPGTGTLCGLGVFCSTQAFICTCSFDTEKDWAFDVCVCVLCSAGISHMLRAACIDVCVCLHMRV